MDVYCTECYRIKKHWFIQHFIILFVKMQLIRSRGSRMFPRAKQLWELTVSPEWDVSRVFVVKDLFLTLLTVVFRNLSCQHLFCQLGRFFVPSVVLNLIVLTIFSSRNSSFQNSFRKKHFMYYLFLLSQILEIQTLMHIWVIHARLRLPDNVHESTWGLLQTAHGCCMTQTATPPRNEQQWSVRGLVCFAKQTLHV